MGEPARQCGLYLARRDDLQRYWWIFRRALLSAYQDNCFGIAKGAAYSALLSFFPVLTTATTILVRANADAVSRSISILVFQVPNAVVVIPHNTVTSSAGR